MEENLSLKMSYIVRIYISFLKRMKIKNLLLALKYQLPVKRFFKNFFISRNAWGLFSVNSHYVGGDINKPKVTYNRYESAKKAANSMSKKYNKHFSVYKCIWCDGFHLGKNRSNK